MLSEVLIILTREAQTKNGEAVVPGLVGPEFSPQKLSQADEAIHAQSHNDFATFSQKTILQAICFYYENIFLD